MSTSARVRRLACVFPAVVAVMLGACREEPWQDGLIWSPDGQHALMFRGGALYVMDAQGNLSAPLSSDLVGGAWLGDSKGLVLVRRHSVRTFGELSTVIGADRARTAVLRSDLLAHLVRTVPNSGDLDVDFGLLDTDPSAVLLYLQERHREVFDRILPDARPIDVAQRSEEGGILHSLSLARLVGKRVELGPTIYQDLGTIKQVRVAPGDRLVGFTHAADAFLAEGRLSLRVAAIDASGSTTVADRDLAESFDWTADGRSLVYLAGSELRQDDAIIFKEGKPRPVSSLAQVIFKPNARIRCLRDGRILFDAAELRYPTTHRPNSREQLFAVHRTGKDIGLAALVAPDTLKHLPESLASFEVSPDGTHVLLTAEDGTAVVLGLADGRLERLEQPAGLTSGRLPRPTWRAPGEFTYVRRTMSGAELVLRRRHTDIVLSQSWPAETVNLLLGEVRPVRPEGPPIARPGS